MKDISTLPSGYQEIFKIDLLKNKRLMLLVNGLAILIGIAMAVPAQFHIPIKTLFSFEDSWAAYILRFAVLIAGTFAYIVLHEAVHGVAMKLSGSKKISYGFTGLYAFAGSSDYYDRRHYIFIALAPVVLWGIVLAVIGTLVPDPWFWVIYIIQISNISGAAGDFYVTAKTLRLPDDILIRDSGTNMTIYSAK